MRWLLDQGLPRSAVALLSALGDDALHVSSLDMSAAPDTEILAVAAETNRVVVTLDADFHSLMVQSGAGRPSVVRIREEGLKGSSLTAILGLISSRFDKELSAGCLLTYSKGKARVRKLPLVG